MKTPEEIKRRKHEYYLKNKDKWNKSKEKNFDREKAIEYAKTYYENNKNKWKEYNKIDSSEKLSNRLEVVRKLKKFYGHSHKREAVLYKGGKCAVCGIKYNGENGAIFDFHHINPKEKDFNISTLFRNCSTIPDKIWKELDKCILVCSNCHRQIHSDKF